MKKQRQAAFSRYGKGILNEIYQEKESLLLDDWQFHYTFISVFNSFNEKSNEKNL